MEVPRHWRMKKQRYALVGETCPHCKARLFPPRAVCPHCAEEARTQTTYAQTGAVLVFEERAVSLSR